MAKAVVIATNGGNGPNSIRVCPSDSGQVEKPQTGDRRLVASQVGKALQERLGAERFAVWFGDGVSIDVAIDGETAGAEPVVAGCIVVSVGNAF